MFLYHFSFCRLLATFCQDISQRHESPDCHTPSRCVASQPIDNTAGMDLPPNNMYDTFKDEIWEELGPLDPDWFDVLTAQTSTAEGSVSDQDELCANQEGNFKTPSDKNTLGSQLFSTPKVFRHSRVVSPEPEDEQSITSEQEKEALQWTATESPCLFQMSKENVPGEKDTKLGPQLDESFDLLHTTPKTPVSYAKQICESLGAQINPDISWTSSLNTPPAVPSTLILSKTDDNPCPATISTDQNIVFVQELFPSLSNVSRVREESPKNKDPPAAHRDIVSPEAGSHHSPQGSLSQSESVWRQKLPDAIEDGEIRSAVASVLDGAENVLSIFFTNSSSALRKVKTDRIKRRQIIHTKEHGCSSKDTSDTNNAVSSEQRTDDCEPEKLLSTPPVKTRDVGITQWSPLSLSEISPSTVNTSNRDNNSTTQVENSILTQQLQSGSGSGRLVRTPLKITDTGFPKKKRQFIYIIEPKTQVQAKETQALKTDSSPGISHSGCKVNVKLSGKTSDDADCCRIREEEIQKVENITDENLPPPAQAKDQDFDMSQLCRDFAQDFTQMLDYNKLSKAPEETPQGAFSPSACLSAMKRAKQTATKGNLHQDCNGISNRIHISGTNQTNFISEGTVSDSGFQSALTDVTHLTTTSFILPSTENIGESQQWTGFKTDNHKTDSFTSANAGNANEILQEGETDEKLNSAIKENQTPAAGRETDLHTESSSTRLPRSVKGATNNSNCFPLGSQAHGSCSEKTTVYLPSINASGFKTASNKGIHISSANLERAKRLFEENEAEGTVTDQPTNRICHTKEQITLSNGSVKMISSNPNHPPCSNETSGEVSCQLTASQKADVTELCTLLEEADSQFEFTQFKTAKSQQHGQNNATSPHKVDKELDPDFLMGIDFDDSFSSDKPNQTNCEILKVSKKSRAISLSSTMIKENPSIESVSSSSKHTSEGSSVMSAEPKSLDRAGYTETGRQENKNPLMLGVGFKTAGGNVLKVSKKCLSKAKALFADLEENLTDQKLPDKHSSGAAAKTKQTPVANIRDKDAAKCRQSGFQMASGKGISISAKALQEADVFFKDCDISDSNTGMSVKHQTSIDGLSGSVSHKKSLSKCKNVQGIKENLFQEPVSGFQRLNAGPAVCRTEVMQHNMEIQNFDFKNTPVLPNAFPLHGNQSSTAKALSSPSCMTSNSYNSDFNKFSNGGGFSTASGKKVPVSADALKKAESFLNETHPPEDTKKHKEDTFTNKTQGTSPKNDGFQTASGKGVVISSAALKKAKSLLSECEVVEDKIEVKPTDSKISVPGLSSRNSGFLAASGKPVVLSSAALQRAKALFSDITYSPDTLAVSDTKNSDRKQDNAGNSDQIHSGFTTTWGASVNETQKNLPQVTNVLKEFDDGSFSEEAMEEVDAFLTDCDFMDSNEEMSVMDGCDAKKKHLLKFKDQSVTNTCEEHGSGRSEFDIMDRRTVVNCENKLHYDDVEIHKRVLKNTPASTGGNTSLMAKPLSTLLCTASKNTGSSAFNTFSNGGGFSTASGKKVSISADALKRAESILNETDPSDDTRTRTGRLTNKTQDPPPKNGFQTASGKGVVISSAALKKAKSLLSECEAVDDKIAVKPTDSKMSVPGLSSENSGFLAASGKPVVLSSAALQRAKALFSDITFSPEAPAVSDTQNSDRKQDDAGNSGHIHSVWKNTPASTNGTPSLISKPLSPSLCAASKNIGSSAFSKFNNGGGFSTASGKKVVVSDEAMIKAKSLLNETPTFSDTNEPSRNGGFLAASGKTVTFSSEALQKAKTLFSDISCSAEIPTVSDLRNDDKHNDTQNTTEKMQHGFTTAGGTKVHVSEKKLLKVKNLLKDFENGESYDSNSHSTGPNESYIYDLLKMKDVKTTSNTNLSTARDMDVFAKESARQAAESFQSLQKTDRENKTLHNSSLHPCISTKEHALKGGSSTLKEGKITPSWEGNLRDTSKEEIANVSSCEVNNMSSSDRPKFKRTEEPSDLTFQSLNLSGCTETQQKLLAQEALDCTKALLEDESLSGQRLTMTLENVSLQNNQTLNRRSAEERKGSGKRSSDDADMTGQPPLKRRLLEEFDRTVDGPKGSTLHPQKSCPNSVMKDRRTFKYSISPHPNITGPHRDGETRQQMTTPTQRPASGDNRLAHSKMSVFIPPFLKNAKTETFKNQILKDKMKTPPAFVPPFNKQRTIVQQSSFKPQEQEEDKCHRLFVTTSSSDAYVLPSKKTQGDTDVPANKSKGDTEVMASAETRHVPVGCGSEGSAAVASHVEDVILGSQDMFQNLENVELARDMQDMRIRKKKRQTIRPLPGSLFQTKTSGVSRIPLKAAGNGKPPAKYTQKQLYRCGVHQHVSDITSETAESFRFRLQQFLKLETFTDGGGVQLADGGWLIPRNDGTAGKEEFYRALCDTPGVDPKLISEEWVFNHYRWIVWKQASMERSFPEAMGSFCLTPEQVLLQLKYRYDVEIDHSRRPALRRIMEKDDTAAKTLVLCVCVIVSRGQSPFKQSRYDTKTPQGIDAKVESSSGVVWLTDGWYAIKAQLDEPLTAMLHKDRLAVGGKLIIYGAQLVGSQDACSPLEAPESLMLKICANSSRPARWDTKLGFYRDPRPFLLPVSSLYSSGGPVGCVDITILRSYPIQWMERKPDGGVVFRSARAEEKEVRRYSSQQQKAMEILFAKIQTEFEKEEKGNSKPRSRRRTISRQDIANLQDGEELFEAVGEDAAYLQAHLSEQQLETLQTYRRSVMEKKQAELQDRYRRAVEAESDNGSYPKRDVTPVWRLCVGDSTDQQSRVYQLNLWRPPSDLQSLLKEGCRYKVYNLTTSEGKKRSSIETVQLTGTKKTQFQDLQASQEWLSTCFQPRVSTNFVNLQNPQFQPLCDEVDLTGCIISIIDGQSSSPAFYLTDGTFTFIKVRCFSSFSQSGLEDVVKPCVILALSNLQLRGQSTSPTPVVYAGDLTLFSTNPKEAHLQESLSQLRNLVQAQENFFQTAEEKLSHLVKSDGLKFISSPSLKPRTPSCTSDRRQDTNTSLISQQLPRNLGSFTPISRNPPAPTSSTEKDPRSLKRRRALDYLSRIPSPPALSHLSSVASPCVNKTFNPPRRSATPSTLLKTVQTPAHKPVVAPMEDEWVNDEELAMIDTQTLRVGNSL